jgi:hypothetical protein
LAGFGVAVDLEISERPEEGFEVVALVRQTDRIELASVPALALTLPLK